MQKIKDYLVYILIYTTHHMMLNMSDQTKISWSRGLAVILTNVFPGRTKIAMYNLKCIYDYQNKQITYNEMKDIVIKSWQNFILTLAENANNDYMKIFDANKKSTAHPHITVAESDTNTLIQAMQNPTGVCLVGAHIASWELGVFCAWDLGYDVYAIVRSMNNEIVNEFYLTNRQLFSKYVIPKNTKTRTLVKAISKGNIAVLLDHHYSSDDKIQFFGKEVQIALSLFERLIKKNKKFVLSHNHRDLDNPLKIQVFYEDFEIQEPPADYDGDKALYNMQRIYQHYEKWIMANPGQWFILHNRWKITPKELSKINFKDN